MLDRAAELVGADEPLGLELVTGAAQLEIGERLLVAQQGVLGAADEIELAEPGAGDGEARRGGPREPDGQGEITELLNRMSTGDKVAEEKSSIEQWLLSVAELGVKQKDGALAADAYARLLVKKPASLDPTRVSLVEQYLDAEFK